MAKKPIRVFRQTSNGTSVERKPVYTEGMNKEKLRITQQVLEHPKTLMTRAREAKGDRYEELLHCLYDAVFVTDLDGRIIEVNARAEHNFMWPRDDYTEMNMVDLIVGADQELLKIVRKNVTNQKYTILEAVCVRADESLFHAEIVVNRLKGPSGDRRLCFFVRDVTVRKQAEEELKEANDRLVEAEKVQARIDTLSTLSYELNNPLQILSCMAEMDDNKEYKKQLSRIVSVLEKLRREDSLAPVVDEEGETRYDISSVADELEECDSKRVLVVDDEELLRNLFVRSLSSSFPYLDIDSAEDGRSAINVFEQHHHSVVVMDISMPVMNGEDAYEAISEICEQKKWKLPRFVFCTGFVVSDHLREVVGNGADHTYLSKPLAIGDMAAAVGSRLSSSV